MSFNAQGNPKYTLENIKNKKFILHHHLGLGDHFVLNGMVNYVSEKYDKIYIPSKIHNFSTVKFMFENNNKVAVFEVGNLTEHIDVDSFAKKNNFFLTKNPYNSAFGLNNNHRGTFCPYPSGLL